MLRSAWIPSAILLLTLAACSSQEAVEGCCTVEGVIKMCDQGVGSDVVISAIEASGTIHEPSADQIIALNKACGKAPIIEALRGEVVAADGEPVEELEEEEKLPRLSLRVSQGSRGIEVFNTSGGPYTNIVLWANKEYSYRLPVTLPPGDGDYIRIASFKNSHGIKLDKSVGVSSLYIRADQGEYSTRF